MRTEFSVFSCILIISLLIAGDALFAWTAPGANPTAGNVAAPLNTGSASQIKAGGLGVGSLDVAGSAIARGSIGATQYCDVNLTNCFAPGSVSQAVPPGSVFYRATETVPPGYLPAYGQAVSRTAYPDLFAAIGTLHGAGDGATTFNVPDLRGEFIRGLDAGRGVDVGRYLGSFQGDQFRSHAHLDNMFQQSHLYDGNVSGTYRAAYPTGRHVNMWTSSAGGNETRPRNIALMPIIKY